MSTSERTQEARGLGRRAAQREATREAVLSAAEDAFAARGFEGTSLTRVAEAAGVPVPLIVYHFDSKLGLWQAVVEAVFGRMVARVEAADAALAEKVTPAALRASIRAHVAAIVENPAYMRITLKEGTEASPRLSWMVETHQRPFSDRILASLRHAQAAGLLPADADPVMLKYLCSGAVSLPFALAPELAALTGEDATADDYAERYTDLCLRVLTGGRVLG